MSTWSKLYFFNKGESSPVDEASCVQVPEKQTGQVAVRDYTSLYTREEGVRKGQKIFSVRGVVESGQT